MLKYFHMHIYQKKILTVLNKISDNIDYGRVLGLNNRLKPLKNK